MVGSADSGGSSRKAVLGNWDESIAHILIVTLACLDRHGMYEAPCLHTPGSLVPSPAANALCNG